ncbi:hypothetical protein HY450_02470 [Candidatus Pacearchaeota archaeon]|nr:hypothetical protein [Candidatus Pacearchaeota archaeon]
MTNETIKVSIRKSVEGRAFGPVRGDVALKECSDAGYEAQFMPTLIDTRIYSKKGSAFWNFLWRTPSIKATGKTKQDNPVVIYAHVPNYFSKHENITEAIEVGLVKGAGKIPREEFQRLLDLEDKERVFVVDYDELKRSTSDLIPVKKALAHPQTIPFLGGKDRAELYLPKHKENYGDQIGIWHSDDLCDEPLARLLYVGDDYCDGLIANYHLNYSGRFFGVPKLKEF